MAIPTVATISPGDGPPIGNHLLEIVGADFRLPTAPPLAGIVPTRPQSVQVLFDGVPALQVLVASATRLFVSTPKRSLVEANGKPIAGPVLVPVEVQNIDDSGVLIPGETATVANGYAYTRTDVSGSNPSQLDMFVRALLRLFKSELFPEINITENTDYDDTASDGLNVAKIAELPAVTITGPRIDESRFYTQKSDQIEAIGGGEFRIIRAPVYVDLVFDYTIVSDNESVFLNLVNLMITVMDQNKFVFVDYGGGLIVRYEFDFDDGGMPSTSKQTDQLNSNINVASGTLKVRGLNMCGIAGVVGFGQQGAGAELTDGVSLESVVQFGTDLPASQGSPMRSPPEPQGC